MQTQPAEDLNAVLGRFQAWAGSRAAAGGTRGVRELTEEQALRSNRYRWKGIGNVSAKKKLDEKAAAAPAVASVKREAADRVRPGRHAAKADPVRQEAAKNIARGSKSKVKSAPEFGEALAEAVRPAELAVAVQPSDAGRPIAISVRMAPAERALIKRRATEAGITTSAYIRQCALEVEQLRSQVRDAFAVMEHADLTRFRFPGLALFPIRKFFLRIARRIFPRKRKVLALKA
ncbi:MAG TPA: hypothetical protein VFW25_14315 [Silvibacterium sp.]|nr:hypothetical protein [Silvibacterium sp.]